MYSGKFYFEENSFKLIDNDIFLREAFDNMEHIYNIADMKAGIMKEIIK